MTDRFITLLLAGAALSAFSTHALPQTAPTHDQPVATNSGEAPGADETPRVSPLVITANSEQALLDTLSPGVVSVVYPDAVKGEHKSLPDLLDQIPGVYARRVGGTGQYTTTSIRGSAPSQVNIYVDGVPYNTASEVAVDISTLPISNVERVEVYRGTTPARFSGAPLGGAINIVTKTPEGLTGSLSAGARSYGGWQQAGSVNLPLLGGNLLLGVDSERSKGDFEYPYISHRLANHIAYGDAAYTYDGRPTTPYSYHNGVGRYVDPLSQLPDRRDRQNNDFLRNNILVKWNDDRFVAKWAYTYLNRAMPTGVLSMGVPYSQIDLPAYTFPAASLPGLYLNRRNEQEQAQNDLALGWSDTFGALTLGVNLNAMDQDKSFRSPDRQSTGGIGTLWSNYLTRRYGAAVDAGWTPADLWGVGQLIELHAGLLQETLYASANDMVPVVGPPSDYFTRFRRYRADVQLQDTLTFHGLGDLQVTPILRLEQLRGPVLGSRTNPLGNPGGDFGWKPTVGLSVKKRFGQGWLLFADAGTYNRFPNFYEIYGDGLYVAPGADSIGKTIPLKREHGWNADVGVGWNGKLPMDFEGSFRLTYFERKTKDAITYYATPIGARYINSGTTLTKGREFEANIAWRDRADLQLAATTQEGLYVEGTYYYFGGSSAVARLVGTDKLHTLQAPVATANARLNLRFLGGDLTTYVEAKYVGRKYVDQVQDYLSYETPLTTIDLGANYRFGEGLALSLGVMDLFDEGPRQRIKGREPLWHSYTTCADPFDWNCLFDPASYVTERHELDRNVNYPQQGRTFYVTLAKTFGGARRAGSAGWMEGAAAQGDWTGFHAGLTWGSARLDNDEAEMLVFDQNRDGNFREQVKVEQGLYDNIFLPGFSGAGAALGNSRAAGVRADRSEGGLGLRAGYDRQFANNWVAGFVVDWASVDIIDAVSAWSDTKPIVPPFTTDPGILANYVLTRRVDQIATIRGRAGVTWRGTLGYVTGGPAWGRADHGFTTTNTVNGFETLNAESTLSGWQYGFGFERRVRGGPFSVGIEALRTELTDDRFMIRVGSNGTTPANDAFLRCSNNCMGGSAGRTDIKRTDEQLLVDSIRLTLGYRF